MPSRRPTRLDEDLRQWRSEFPEATPIADLRLREPATIVGVVTRIRVVPGGSLTLRLTDGTGDIEAVWAARGHLRGVTLGTALRLSATVAETGSGLRLLRNPAWSLVAEPFSFSE